MQGPSHAHEIRVADLEDRLGGLAGCDAPGDRHDFAQVAVAGGVEASTPRGISPGCTIHSPAS